jgi:hypothetical protein
MKKTLVQYQWMDVKVQIMCICHTKGIVMVSLELSAFASTGFMSDVAICNVLFALSVA